MASTASTRPSADRAAAAEATMRRELRGVAAESDRNQKLVVDVPGAVDVLAAVFAASANAKSEGTAAAVREEAVEVISSLQVPEQCLRRVAETNEALVSALQRSSAKSWRCWWSASRARCLPAGWRPSRSRCSVRPWSCSAIGWPSPGPRQGGAAHACAHDGVGTQLRQGGGRRRGARARRHAL
ncbi:unnamed protein product [Miscanthus lutarioriparius]|uniref:Uncharacterized protein n=1 Tax=Miscanthus lutarioriparius TaxID=422564 RepID=A0A811PLJ6_9POAL|nr:unnamed protein product [Miscanthus lutarioriparius]